MALAGGRVQSVLLCLLTPPRTAVEAVLSGWRQLVENSPRVLGLLEYQELILCGLNMH